MLAFLLEEDALFLVVGARLALEITEALGPPPPDQADDVRTYLHHIKVRAKAALSRAGESIPQSARD